MKVMKTRKIILACSLIFAIAWGGCGQDNNNSISKEEAAKLAKADDTTDLCEIYGWYGDGICDTFCLNPDPDCDSENQCYVGGCSSEICSDTPNVASACVYHEYYQCYEQASCGRLPSGKCGWTGDDDFIQCLYANHACPLYSQELPPPWYCEGGELVDQDPLDNGCPLPKACERKEGATCGGEHDFICDEGYECIDGICHYEEPIEGCYIAGPYGEICSNTYFFDVVTDGIEHDYYQCYELATCSTLASGNCGWIGDDDFVQCLYANHACPLYSQELPPPWYCEGGELVDQDPLANGCPLPKACERKEGATCGGEHEFVCDEGFACEAGICEPVD
jgi:eight-cysteine-cluster-containing protein